MNPYAKFLGKRDPLREFMKTPGRISTLIRGLSQKELAKRPAPGKWSILEIITHLAETEMVMACRSRWIAFEDDPTLVPFDQDKWAQGWAREKEPVSEIFERFRLLRRAQARLFRGASKADYRRAGYHQERGRITLKMQLETIAGHDLNHLAQIRRLASQLRAVRRSS